MILDGLEAVRKDFGESFVPSDIRRILLTHSHFDHFGGAGGLAAFLDAEIWAHPAESRNVCAQEEQAYFLNHVFDRYLQRAGVEPERRRKLIRGFGFTPGRTRSVPVDRLIEADETLDDFLRVHHTPGHSPGHLCFEAGPFLILGDLLLSRTITQIWPQTVIPGTGLERHLESLDRLEKIVAAMRSRGLNPQGFPGHEDIIPDIPYRLNAIRRNHQRRCERLLDILDTAAEPLNVERITAKMYLSSSLGRSLMALLDVGARIEYLHQYGRVAVADAASLDNDPLPVYRYRTVR